MFFIATPSWNYGRFIGDAVQSVRRQSPARSHHVQDALSEDGTPDVLEAHGWGGLSVVREADEGQCDALNRAFARTPPDAEYLGWLNADEFYLPGAFEAVRRTFEAHPDVDVVYGDTFHVDAAGRLLRLVAQHGFSRTALRSMRHLYIQTSSTFFRRRVLESGGLHLDQGYRQAMDQELFVRLDAGGARFHHVRVPLSCFRVHDMQLTAQHGRAIADEEFRAVSTAFGYRPRPWVGRADHRLRKVTGGAYLRERRAAAHRGQELRWFSDTAVEDVSRVLVGIGRGAGESSST